MLLSTKKFRNDNKSDRDSLFNKQRMSLHKNHELGKSIRTTGENPDPDSGESNAFFSKLTGSGRSAIAVLILQGSGSKAIIQRCFEPASDIPYKVGQIRYGSWVGGQLGGQKGVSGGGQTANETGDQPAESVVITPQVGGCFEIHCHGGPAAVARIEGDLLACGANPIEHANLGNLSKKALLIQEAEMTLTQCTTTRTAAIAMDQVRGALAKWALAWQKSLNAANLATFRKEQEELLESAACTTRLTEPFRVVLTGPPNVGKSSLLNALVGFDRSITLDMAGTTRDLLHANTVIAGLPVRLSDTAGIREDATVESIEQEGIRIARLAMEQADLLLLVCQPMPDGSYSSIPTHPPEIAQLRILNKIDKKPDSCQSPDNSTYPFDVSTNPLTGQGLAELVVTIGSRLGDNLPESGKPALLNKRQWEIMKESLCTDSPEQISQHLGHLLGHHHG